jgi:Icc-related predicted phosphoesterase
MKITVISDTHQSHNLLSLKPADMLIYCGDIDAYNQSDLWQFNKWLGKQPFIYKIVIAGNHDRYLEECGFKSVQKQLSNAIYLENSSIKIKGINFYGSPITPTFLDWYFMCDRNNISKYWNAIPLKTDVLITHGPPFGILDYAIYSKEHVGCAVLLERINVIKPKLHCFGHIHYNYGIYKNEHTTFINASLMNEQYALVNKPISI